MWGTKTAFSSRANGRRATTDSLWGIGYFFIQSTHCYKTADCCVTVLHVRMMEGGVCHHTRAFCGSKNGKLKNQLNMFFFSMLKLTLVKCGLMGKRMTVTSCQCLSRAYCCYYSTAVTVCSPHCSYVICLPSSLSASRPMRYSCCACTVEWGNSWVFAQLVQRFTPYTEVTMTGFH